MKYIVSTMIDKTKMYISKSNKSKTENWLSCRKSEAVVFTEDSTYWVNKGYDVEPLPEDQIMRLVDAPMLPGMEG